MDMPANAKMQTISGKKYVFIDTPYWNAEKHRGEHKRRYIGKIVEYIPVEINEEKNMVIGRIDKILNDYTYPLENEEDVILGTKLQGAIKDLFPTGCFIPVSPGKDVLCYFSPSINKNIDVEVGSKVLFTINKNCDGKFRGKVVEVLR